MSPPGTPVSKELQILFCYRWTLQTKRQLGKKIYPFKTEKWKNWAAAVWCGFCYWVSRQRSHCHALFHCILLPPNFSFLLFALWFPVMLPNKTCIPKLWVLWIFCDSPFLNLQLWVHRYYNAIVKPDICGWKVISVSIFNSKLCCQSLTKSPDY